MKRFDSSGICLFGSHRGTHASKLPAGWVAWASSNVEGFREAYEAAKTSEPPPPIPPRRPTGRTYILKPFKRRS